MGAVKPNVGILTATCETIAYKVEVSLMDCSLEWRVLRSREQDGVNLLGHAEQSGSIPGESGLSGPTSAPISRPG